MLCLTLFAYLNRIYLLIIDSVFFHFLFISNSLFTLFYFSTQRSAVRSRSHSRFPGILWGEDGPSCYPPIHRTHSQQTVHRTYRTYSDYQLLGVKIPTPPQPPSGLCCSSVPCVAAISILTQALCMRNVKPTEQGAVGI
jgi:hypothetical protein